jgi:hypothetical protein
MPHHYAFTRGWLGERVTTKSDTNPHHFQVTSRHAKPVSELSSPASGSSCDCARRRDRRHPAATAGLDDRKPSAMVAAIDAHAGTPTNCAR